MHSNVRWVFIFLVAFSTLSAQKKHLQVGLLSAQNEYPALTPNGTSHYGYRAGIDVKIFGLGLYALAGSHYYSFPLSGQVEREFFQINPRFHVIKGRAGLGLTPFGLGPIMKIRLKAMGAYSYLISGHESTGLPGVKRNFTGLDVGAGISLGWLTLDIEYEKGWRGIIEGTEQSKFNILSLTAGLHF